MTVAVTGATGHFGRLAIEALLNEPAPEPIVAVVRDRAKAADLSARGVEVREADYDDAGALRAAFEGVDRLLFVSGSQVGRRVAQHQNVIDAAVEAKVSRVVYTSAPHATTSDLILAPEHKATEELLAASGLTYVAARNNWYNENYIHLLGQAAATGEIVGAAGEGRVASASRADFALGAVRLLLNDEGPTGAVELSGTSAWSFPELAEILTQIVGRTVTYRNVTPEELQAEQIAAGVPEGGAAFAAGLDNNISHGALAEVTATLTELIGHPTTPVAETLAAAYRAQQEAGEPTA